MVLGAEAQEVVVLSRGRRQKKTSCLLTMGQALIQPSRSPTCSPVPDAPRDTFSACVHRQESQGATPADTGHSEEGKTATRRVRLHRIPKKKQPSETPLTQASLLKAQRGAWPAPGPLGQERP